MVVTSIVNICILTMLRALCFFLRARAVVKVFLRAASTLESTDGEQRAL